MSTDFLTKLNRFQATGLHFLASVVVLAIIFSFIKFVWYPGGLFFAANGFDLLKILIAVDLILGPLIMLIIFNPKKKSIKFDVSAILICQLVFLGYGLWSLYTVRPAYIAFVENQFTLVKANEIESENLAKVEDMQFGSVPLLGPKFVGTKMPDSKEKRDELLFASFENLGIQNFPQYFVSLDKVTAKILAASQPLEKLDLNENQRESLAKLNLEMKAQARELLFCPLTIKDKRLFVAVDATNNTILGIY